MFTYPSFLNLKFIGDIALTSSGRAFDAFSNFNLNEGLVNIDLLVTNFTSTINIEPEHISEPAKKAGLPQFDFSTYPSQIFWLIVIFAILYTVMSSRFLPKIAAIIEKRLDRISNDIDKASEIEKEVALLIEKKDSIIKKSREDAQKVMADAMMTIGQQKDEKISALTEKLKNQKTIDEKNFAEITKDAVKNIEKDAKDISALIVSKLI